MREIKRASSCFPNHPEIGGLQRPLLVLTLRCMNLLATGKIRVLMALLLSLSPCRAGDFDAVDGPNVRVMRQEDGSRSIFIRSPDSRTLTKKTFSPNGVITMLTVYKMDANQNPLGCKISDGQGNELYKVSYGYHKTTGLLVQEKMFDSRVRRINPANGAEMPVQLVVYLYDGEGKRSAPIVYNLLPGKKMEDVFGVKTSELKVNPFKSGGKP